MMRETKTLFTVTKHWSFGDDTTRLRDWVVLILIIGGVLVFVAGIFTVGFFINHAACGRVGERLEREVIFDFWGEGCFIQTDDGLFIPESNFRITNEE